MSGTRNLDEGYDSIEFIDWHHVPYVFPWCSTGSCARTLTLNSSASANTWSDWTVIVDNLGNKLSDQFASKGGYFSAIIAEAVSKKDNLYQIEFAYGTAKSVITRFRAIAGDTKISTDSGKNLRNPYIPAGQELYYRCASEDGSQSISGQVRFYYEDGA
jgi:hypothetical protein